MVIENGSFKRDHQWTVVGKMGRGHSNSYSMAVDKTTSYKFVAKRVTSVSVLFSFPMRPYICASDRNFIGKMHLKYNAK